MEIRQLEAFCAVAEQGSFSRAALSLGLSQSTVSTHIKNLEQDLHSRQPHIDALAAQIQDLNERLASSEAQTASLRTELQASKQELESLKNSTSWKLTKPLRALKHKK